MMTMGMLLVSISTDPRPSMMKDSGFRRQMVGNNVSDGLLTRLTMLLLVFGRLLNSLSCLTRSLYVDLSTSCTSFICARILSASPFSPFSRHPAIWLSSSPFILISLLCAIILFVDLNHFSYCSMSSSLLQLSLTNNCRYVANVSSVRRCVSLPRPSRLDNTSWTLAGRGMIKAVCQGWTEDFFFRMVTVPAASFSISSQSLFTSGWLAIFSLIPFSISIPPSKYFNPPSGFPLTLKFTTTLILNVFGLALIRFSYLTILSQVGWLDGFSDPARPIE